MSFNNLKITIPRLTETPSPPDLYYHHINIVNTEEESTRENVLTIKQEFEDSCRLLGTPPSSPTSLRRLSTSVYPSTSPQSSTPSSPTHTPLQSLTQPALSRNRTRRNTVCYKSERKPNKNQGQIGDEENVKNLMIPPKILRRSSAPQLNMIEITTLARAGISTNNLLNLINVSASLEKINKDWEIFNLVKFGQYNWIVNI